MCDEMPKWMLKDHTEEELKILYDNLPFVHSSMTFDEYIREWERQRKEI